MIYYLSITVSVITRLIRIASLLMINQLVRAGGYGTLRDKTRCSGWPAHQAPANINLKNTSQRTDRLTNKQFDGIAENSWVWIGRQSAGDAPRSLANWSGSYRIPTIQSSGVTLKAQTLKMP
jgi:hypothetical protein